MKIKDNRNNKVKRILPDVLLINVPDNAINKLSAFIRFEIGNLPLFTYIDSIYGEIYDELEEPEKYIIIPFIDDKMAQNLTIQKIG